QAVDEPVLEFLRQHDLALRQIARFASQRLFARQRRLQFRCQRIILDRLARTAPDRAPRGKLKSCFSHLESLCYWRVLMSATRLASCEQARDSTPGPLIVPGGSRRSHRRPALGPILSKIAHIKQL